MVGFIFITSFPVYFGISPFISHICNHEVSNGLFRKYL